MRRLAAIALFLAGLVSCAASTGTGGPISQVIMGGFLRPENGNLYFGPGLLSLQDVVRGTKPCEGASGSILPPLAVNQCVGDILASILPSFQGIDNNPDQNHLYLTGIERYFVHQSQENDCWAATIQMARDYLHYTPVSQEELINASQRACPNLSAQSNGADAYQIAFSVASTLKQYDQSRTIPHFCPNIQCIVSSLQKGHPIIVLGEGHAVLMIGMDFVVLPPGKHGPIFVVQHIYVLDPANEYAQVEKWSPFTFCKADAFISY